MAGILVDDLEDRFEHNPFGLLPAIQPVERFGDLNSGK